MTLVACTLLGLEVGPSLLFFGFAVLTGIGGPYFLLHGALGLIGGYAPGVVLLGQGASPYPIASRGALAGLVVGVVPVFLLSVPIFGGLGMWCW
ncbi:MAG: hypothetical protein M3R38_14770 [Actinomycetota bacterium]|nr:hypothetical protein [Actinomycetota bacterium]